MASQASFFVYQESITVEASAVYKLAFNFLPLLTKEANDAVRLFWDFACGTLPRYNNFYKLFSLFVLWKLRQISRNFPQRHRRWKVFNFPRLHSRGRFFCFLPWRRLHWIQQTPTEGRIIRKIINVHGKLNLDADHLWRWDRQLY